MRWGVCDPQVLLYRVKVVDGVSGTPEPVTGVPILGVVDNPNIGRITPDVNTTKWASSIYPGAADFMFQAERPGTTIVAFSGMIKTPGWFGTDFRAGASQLVSNQVDIRVVPCKFKVNSVSIFRAGMTSVGMMNAVMESDANGSFTGTATLNWVTSMICGISSPIDPGTADLTGKLNESGQLVGEIIFGPMTSVGGGPCGLVTVNTSNFGTLDPLTINASYAGVSVYTQAQGITVTNGSFTGTASIVVIPQEQEAVAFNADSRAALSPPAWWAMLWDEFPGLFGALLALR